VRLRVFIFALCSVLLVGCGSFRVPLKEERVNGNIESVTTLLKELSNFNTEILAGKKISLEEALCRLQVCAQHSQVVYLKPEDAFKRRYVDSLRLSDPDQLAELVAGYSGVVVPFAFKKQEAALALPFHVRSYYSGYEVEVTLICKQGNLVSAYYSGTSRIDRSDKDILINPFESAPRWR
jgi:hypothetical protein